MNRESELWRAVPHPFYYPRLGGEFRPIPKGLRPLAQGCAAGAALGGVESGSTPTGLWRTSHDDDATPLGLILIPCGFSKVARAAQAWALSQNPVGIQSFGFGKLWVIERTRHRFVCFGDSSPKPSRVQRIVKLVGPAACLRREPVACGKRGRVCALQRGSVAPSAAPGPSAVHEFTHDS